LEDLSRVGPTKSFHSQHQTSSAIDALVMRTASAAMKPYQGDSSEFYVITSSNPDGGRRCDEVLKLKNFKKDDYTSFQDQEKYEHVGLKVTSSQEGKRSHDDDKRLYSVDDLKEAQRLHASQA
ncbi:hypothetical protein Tco_0942571, partial [Tanacetum coccineum]